MTATNKKRTSLVLLSIIAPISVLVGLRLGGLLQAGPLTYDTITANTVTYHITRPPSHLDINQVIKNQYSNPLVSLCLQVHVYSYYEKDLMWDGNDVILSGITTTANVSKGFIYSLVIKFSYTNNSVLGIFGGFSWIEEYNVKVSRIPHLRMWNSFIEATGVNQPKNSSLAFRVEWMFWDHPHQMQNMTISAEILHFNGTAYQKYVIPIFLEMFDVGNNRNDALEIKGGCYKDFVGWNDPSDFYKIWIKQNQYINITVYPNSPNPMSLDLFLYDMAGNLQASSTNSTIGSSELISFNVDSTGWWYIEIRFIPDADEGLYQLSVEVS